jgi:hypothetical protein
MAQHPYPLDALYAKECDIFHKQPSPSHALDILQFARNELDVTSLSDSDKVAVWVVAPVLAGFALWLKKHLVDTNSLALGVMREGRFLCTLLDMLFDIKAHEIELNRHFCLLAAFHAGDDEALVNWLVRTRVKPLSHADLSKILPLYNPQMGSRNQTINLDEAEHIAKEWRKLGTGSPIYKLAESTYNNVLNHWQNITKRHNDKTFALIDFASAGNIQRSLQTLFQSRNSKSKLLGLNFATTQGTKWAKAKGCELHGFLAEDGAPTWIADAYARSPDIIEIFVAAPVGSLAGYDAGGQAIREPTFLKPPEVACVQNWQSLILEAAKIYIERMGEHLTPEFCRSLWGRFLLHPLPVEAMAFATWPIDVGLDGSTSRQLAPTLSGDPSTWSKIQTAWPAASVLRMEITHN